MAVTQPSFSAPIKELEKDIGTFLLTEALIVVD
ncbi:hypothetical protein GG851_07675 [Bordetella petrii]|nr:hypothetical protein [Bordetella petrii]